MSLYEQHATYLLRMIKTHQSNNIQAFISQIPTFISEATCHEIALNDHFSCDLATHQNKKGKEKEYCNHPDALKIGRNLRVKLIWELVQSELLEDPSLDSFKTYSDKELKNYVKCPYCNEIQWELSQEIVGTHGDGTDNIQEHWIPINVCEHWVQNDFESETSEEQDIDYLFREIEDLLWNNECNDVIESMSNDDINSTHIRDICLVFDLEYEHVFLSEDQYGNPDHLLFVKDLPKLRAKLESILKSIKQQIE